jgi:hypothetical protein
MARLMWYVISVTFDVKIPESNNNFFGPGLSSFAHKQRKLVLLLFVGLYGSVEMRLSSNDQNLHLFCR